MESESDGTSFKDPDTPQQKYYTVMIERIPPHLRSASALYQFFHNLFPDEVYAVEISLDLTNLNALCQKRLKVGHNCRLV
jgi:hypothetical protein